MFSKENGLTASHATHLCNVASNLAEELRKQLNSLSPQTIVVSFGSSFFGNKDKIYRERNLDPAKAREIVEQIAGLMRLNAYLRNAVEEKTKMLIDLDTEEIDSLPPAISAPLKVTEKWALNKLSIKDRAEYLGAHASAAAVGKAIHEDGCFRRWMAQVTDPNWCSSVYLGGNEVPASYQDRIAPEEISAQVRELEKLHRKFSSQVNSYLSKMKDMIDEENRRRRREWEKAESQRNLRIQAIATDFDERRKEVSQLKIEVPNDLQPLIDELGKKENK